jgi:acetyl esterase/lipase
MRFVFFLLSATMILTVASTSAWAQAGRSTTSRAVYRDVEYKRKETTGRPLTLDVYHPEGDAPEAGWPTVVWIHGGAWQAGDKHLGLPYVLPAGIAVVSIRYRLSGEAQWPAQIEDCKAAVRFLRAHAATYKIDPSRLAVSGASAGGHLAAMIGTAGNDKTYDVGDHLDHSSAVLAVVDLFGPTNFLAMIGQPSQIDHAAANVPEALLLGGPIESVPDKVKLADPLYYIDQRTPPFLILHGEKDDIVPVNQSEILHAALQQNKIFSEYLKIVDAGHGGPAFETPEIRTRVIEFLKEHLVAPTESSETTAEPWELLFPMNGRPVGWRVTEWSDVGKDVAGHDWEITDGTLRSGDNRGTWLVSEAVYDNFELQFEIKLTERGNSGVALRSPSAGDPAFDGLEFQVADFRYNTSATESELTGGLYRAVAPSAQVYKPTEWNQVTIRIDGSKFQATLNDQVIQDIDLNDFDQPVLRHDGTQANSIKDRPTSGHIGFQHLSREGRVEIRAARIRKLSK